MTVRVVTRVALLVGLGACARREWVPDYLAPECRGFRHAPSESIIEAAPELAGNTDELRGRVIVAGIRQALPGAAVVLGTALRRVASTDSLGYFSFDGIPPGTFILQTRRIGTRGRVDTLTIPRLGGGVILPLDLDVLDGPCSGFGLVEVRKPWWKLW